MIRFLGKEFFLPYMLLHEYLNCSGLIYIVLEHITCWIADLDLNGLTCHD